jgi:Protein of unknown function (DUF1761)
MEMNFTVIALAALLPLVVGFVWYNPKVLGNAWMQSIGMTEESMKGSNMGLIFGVTYIFSFFLAVAMQFLTIHQYSLYSIVADQPDYMNPASEAGMMVQAMLDKYGTSFRSFGHGALHGTISAITIALPVLGINALFERRSAKYIFIHLGYWVITFALMGGVICAYA